MQRIPFPVSLRDSPWRGLLLLAAAACIGAAAAAWWLHGPESAGAAARMPPASLAAAVLFGAGLLCTALALLAPRRMQAMSRIADGSAGASSAEGRAAANVAHELRTPLAAIKIHAQVALHAGGEAERRAAIERTLEAIDQAAHLMQQLLELSRVDGVASLSSQLRPLQLPAVVRRVVEELRPLAGARSQVIAESLAHGDIDGVEFGVAVLMRNLIENAMRYGPARGTIRVGTGSDAAGAAWLVVEDAGPGIPVEHRQRVFERYQRLAADEQGSGIGLSIVRAVVQLHGAGVELGDSDLGGLRVTVRFPVPARVPAISQTRGDPALRPMA